jgi:hypothetical protein
VSPLSPEIRATSGNLMAVLANEFRTTRLTTRIGLVDHRRRPRERALPHAGVLRPGTFMSRSSRFGRIFS